MPKNDDGLGGFKENGYMKSSKRLFEETMELMVRFGYKVVYVPHSIIEDYNATYNVMFEGKHIITGAAEKLRIPLNEIWVSELWKPYERFIVFHELREIFYRAEGFGGNEAHEKAVNDGVLLWKDDLLFQKMIKDIAEKDRKTAQRKSRQGLG